MLPHMFNSDLRFSIILPLSLVASLLSRGYIVLLLNRHDFLIMDGLWENGPVGTNRKEAPCPSNIGPSDWKRHKILKDYKQSSLSMIISLLFMRFQTSLWGAFFSLFIVFNFFAVPFHLSEYFVHLFCLFFNWVVFFKLERFTHSQGQ